MDDKSDEMIELISALAAALQKQSESMTQEEQITLFGRVLHFIPDETLRIIKIGMELSGLID